MKYRAVLLILVGAAVICGCSTTIVDAGNSFCNRRVQSDSERCYRNVRSSDQALAEKRESERASKDSWAKETLEGIAATATQQKDPQ